MKFALVNGNKAEATKGANGLCPSCGSELIAKCGELKVNHWAHKGNRNCDPWWENETDWHRSWKGHFPMDWQEVVHFDARGEKHIADVKTESGWVLEFQHSYLSPEERRSRNTFYSKISWVVDGARRKADMSQFRKILEDSTTVSTNPLIKRVYFPEECRLLKEWRDRDALVFFDFQDAIGTEQPMLWFLFPEISISEAFISPFLRINFIELHSQNKFGEMVQNAILPIRNILAGNKQTGLMDNTHFRQNILSELVRYPYKMRRPRRL